MLKNSRVLRLPLSAALALLALLALGLGLASQPTAAAAASESTQTTSCTLYASPSGSDSGPGTEAQPLATVERLVRALGPGQTGCLRGGTYAEDVSIPRGGSEGAPVTLTSYPGERADVVGRLWIEDGANYVTVANLNLNGKNAENLPSPTVNDDYASFVGDDVTNEHTGICFLIGSSWGRAEHTLIQGNRIHDCGTLPAGNHDHGIYDEESVDTRIVNNVIFNNADRGIQLYPNAQGTTIEHNVIDANGEGIIFSGLGGVASSNTTVRDNLLTNARIRYNVESWYPAGNPMGTANVVEDNCLWGGAEGTIADIGEGFSAINNITANPEYANESEGDFMVSAGSACAALIAGVAVPVLPFSAVTSGNTYIPSSGSSTTTTGTSGSDESNGTVSGSGESVTAPEHGGAQGSTKKGHASGGTKREGQAQLNTVTKGHLTLARIAVVKDLRGVRRHARRRSGADARRSRRHVSKMRRRQCRRLRSIRGHVRGGHHHSSPSHWHACVTIKHHRHSRQASPGRLRNRRA